jgi:hypothetical protein
MRIVYALGIVSALAFASPALAVKEQFDVTPQSIPHVEGMTIETTVRDDGTIDFTVTRDPSKARWQSRDGLLEIADAQGDAVECYVQGETKKGGQVEYWFAVAPRHLENATFTLIEVQTDPNAGPDDEQLIGGGTYYRFRLSDFASQPHAKSEAKKVSNGQ